MEHDIDITVNGEQHRLRVPPEQLLLDCLRRVLDLTGTKEGCAVGVCGACTVLVDGRPVSACLELAIRCDGARVDTIEGLAVEGLAVEGLAVEGLAEGDTLHPIQQAFIDEGGFQCGICTPGMVMATRSLLDSNPDPSSAEIREYLMGNLCRCTGYYKIEASVIAAAKALRST